MEESMIQQQEAIYMPLRLGSVSSSSDSRREYEVSFIKAGRVRRRDGKEANWLIPRSTVRAAVEQMGGKAVFVDHTLGGFFMPVHPSLRSLAGVTFDAVWNDEAGRVDGGIRLSARDDLAWLGTLLDEIVADQAAGREVPDVGLSLVFFGNSVLEDDPEGEDGAMIRITKSIDHVESCDIVFGPGAEGRIREVLSRVDSGALHNLSEVFTMPEEIQATNGTAATSASVEAAANDLPASVAGYPNPHAHAVALSAGSGLDHSQGLDHDGDHALGQNRLDRLEGAVLSLADSVARLQGTVAQRLAHQEERRVISDMGVGVAPRDRAPAQVRGSWLNSLDQVELAYDQLMGLPVSGPVHQFSGIRELYLLLTGDRNFRGEYNRDLVPSFLAYSSSGNNADTSTMAELTRNVMNKRLIQQSDLLAEYSWWKQIAHTDNFNSLQQISWVRYGGIGYDSGTGLPSVAEKGEYQQLLWEDDRTTADWTKYGGYLPLSLEMIDRDDVMGWKDVPRQLAVAQAVTISSVVSALFTDNSGAGADLSDSVGDGYAFNTTRGNLITQALDQDTWGLAVETMYKLTQLLNSTVSESRRLAARPRKLLVPIELEQDGITATTSAVKAGTLADRYPGKRLLREEDVITVPHWTNATNWAALADPNICPFAGVGFRFGEMPEIFAPSENNHILWLNDVLPIKTRWFFAVSVIEWRGGIKSNQT